MKYFKILGPKGECINGGFDSWFLPKGKKPGKWMPKVEKLIPCKSGYHICKEENIRDWIKSTCKIYEVEYRGETIDHENKCVVQQARLIRNVTKKILKKFANDKSAYVRVCVAENPNTPKEILKKLANDKDDYVRVCVAENPNTPKEILKKLSNDKDYYVRMYVVKNPNTPKEILKKLANDENLWVRECVAENPNTPKETLKKLANDESYYVRKKIADRKILKKLANDEQPYVRICCKKPEHTERNFDIVH